MSDYTLILNSNGWRDVIECLESVFRSEAPAQPVIVCDNDSEDGSLGYIRAWAEGRLDAYVHSSNPLRPLSWPPIDKPIEYAEYGRAEAERGGDSQVDAPLILIATGSNLGFAGGCNVGLRYVLARGDFDHVWLLNPDTVVRSDSLGELLQAMRRSPRAGMCGSTLLYYHMPERVQVLGGADYNRWLALPRHIGEGQPATQTIDEAAVVSRMSYVYGASMLISREFLEDVGLLSEEYFLYFEELDWAMRARGRFDLAYASKSIVYHREGGAIGATTRDRDKSPIADRYYARNRIRFTRKFLPHMLPAVYLALLASMFRRARRGQWDRVRMIAGFLLAP